VRTGVPQRACVPRQAERFQLLPVEPVAREHDFVAVATELRDVLGDLLEPGSRGRRVEAGRRELDDPVAGGGELVEQRLEQRVRDDGDAAGAGVGAQRRIASSRRSSSPGS
jgi:hypothetical protein